MKTMKPEETFIERHPDETLLAAYLEAPKSESTLAVRQHLITCPLCREKVASDQSMSQALRRTPSVYSEKPEEDHPDELAVADYVEKRLPSDQQRKFKTHLSECAYCTKAVLHYALSTTETAEEAPVFKETIQTQPKPETVQTGESPVTKLRRFFSWKMPVWIGVPATALAAVALLLVVYTGEKETRQLVAYQDSPEVIFSSPKGRLPGMGFLGKSRERSEPFAGIKIELEDETHLHLKWSKIKTALLYEVKIYSSKGSDRTVIAEAPSSVETEVFLQVSTLLPDQHYEWELRGQTKDGLSFLTKGGFVVGIQVKF